MDALDYRLRGGSDICIAPGNLAQQSLDTHVLPRALPLFRTLPESVDRYVQGKHYRFGYAQQPNDIASAAGLVKKRYAWRGYDVEGALANMQPASEITLIASCVGAIHGTLTVRLDGRVPLLSEKLYPDEIARLRAQGARLCEVGRLALEEHVNTLEILGPLFHLAVAHAHGANGCTDAVMEVNPRHIGFYRRLFGFNVLGEERACERVSAPAVLLKLSLREAAQRAEAEGGTQTGHRSIYPYCLQREELGSARGHTRHVNGDGRRDPSVDRRLAHLQRSRTTNHDGSPVASDSLRPYRWDLRENIITDQPTRPVIPLPLRPQPLDSRGRNS